MFGQIYFRVLGIGCFLSMALLLSAQRGCVKTLAQPFSIIYRPVIFSFVYAAFFSFIW